MHADGKSSKLVDGATKTQFEFELCQGHWEYAKAGAGSITDIDQNAGCKAGHQAFFGVNGVCKYTFDSPVARGLNKLSEDGNEIS